jgi:hypothetical protein
MKQKLFAISRRIIILLCAFGISQLSTAHVMAVDLQKNAIIAQSEKDYNGITEAQINNFLSSKGSQLAGYTIPRDFEVYFPVGQGQWDKIVVPQEWQTPAELEVYHGKTVAALIHEWSTVSRDNRGAGSPSPGQINPLIALATLDKESASVTASYRTSILSRQVTLSWLMGYGYNDRMANCFNYGDCDVDYNRQRALYYGGPGQQLAEGISALKRWSTNPTALSSCTTRWQNYRINGECLELENSISYALYRYTPNFSGNQLFLNLYTSIKSGFSATPTPAPTNDTDNDIAAYELRTYSSKVSLVGKKTTPTRAYFDNKILSDINASSWNLEFEPSIGDKTYIVQYKRSDGSLVNQKNIRIIRNTVGDMNSDGKVDILDLSLLSTFWGHTDPTDPLANMNPDVDNEVNILDLSLLASNFQ